MHVFRTVALGICTGAMILLHFGPAQAAPEDTFEVDYDAVGVSTLHTGANVSLGPTTMKTYLPVSSGDGGFTGELPLPSTNTSFKVAGFVPVSATVNFEPAGELIGQMSQEVPLTVSATAKYYLRLSNVTMGGLPGLVGDHCRTVEPVSIPVATPDGESFDLTNGGILTGSYSVGAFEHCGINTWLLNLVVPGPGNHVELHLENGRFVG